MGTARAQFVLQVKTTDGAITVHEFWIDHNEPARLQLINDVLTSMQSFYLGGGLTFALDNPFVIYRAEHVVSVQFSVDGEADIGETIRERIPGLNITR